MAIAKDKNGNYLVLDGVILEDGLFKGFKNGALVFTTPDMEEFVKLAKKHNLSQDTIFKTI